MYKLVDKDGTTVKSGYTFKTLKHKAKAEYYRRQRMTITTIDTKEVLLVREPYGNWEKPNNG